MIIIVLILIAPYSVRERMNSALSQLRRSTATAATGRSYYENGSTFRAFVFYILSILSTPRREYAES